MSAAEQRPARVQAFILAGGRGSRLAPLTTVIPKPLVPVGDLPILEVLIRQLVAAGIADITVSLGYLGHLIRAVVGDGTRFGARVTYTEEDQPLGTAGALALLGDVDDDDTVLVLNGDTLTDLSYGALIDRHRASGAEASLVVLRREIPIDFGVIEVGENDRLAGYAEKPRFDFLVSIGINVFRGRALARIAPGESLDMPTFLLRLRDDGAYVRCHEADCFWLDLGRLEDLRHANQVFTDNHERFLPG
jgi:NDP-sugar pyrophosphorylase family protein